MALPKHSYKYVVSLHIPVSTSLKLYADEIHKLTEGPPSGRRPGLSKRTFAYLGQDSDKNKATLTQPSHFLPFVRERDGLNRLLDQVRQLWGTS